MGRPVPGTWRVVADVEGDPTLHAEVTVEFAVTQ